MLDYTKFTEDQLKLLAACADKNPAVAQQAQAFFASVAEQVLREGIMAGDIKNFIFSSRPFKENEPTIFPLSFLQPGTEDDYTAYVIPAEGKLPVKLIRNDELTVPTYEMGNSIGWSNRFARYSRVDVTQDALSVMKAGFVKKMNDDAYATLLAAAVDRNILVYDSAAGNGQFTKRIVSLMKTIMRRNGGGNSTSMNRHVLTDLILSPELVEDMRNWNIDQVDETTRREIYLADDTTVKRVFGVNLHDTDEFGVGQQYQQYYTDVLGGTMNGTDVEILLGLDLRGGRPSPFVMPVVEDVNVYPNPDLFTSRRQGYWGTCNVGFGVLDNRNVVVASA